MSISKRPLIALVAKRTGLSQATVANVLDALKDTILEHVKSGIAVNWTGFGTFQVDLHQGHPVNLPHGPKFIDGPYRVLRFAASGAAKRRIRDDS